MVCAPSPPVPQVSAHRYAGPGKGSARSLIACAAPAISSGRSPFALSAMSSAAISTSSSSPLAIMRNSSPVWALVRWLPL